MRKKLTIIGHPKFIEKNVPRGTFDYYEIEIESTFKKPKGATQKRACTDAMVARARRKMKEGMSATEAAANTAAFLQGRANMSKLYPDRPEGVFRGKWYQADKPGEGLYRTILSGLTHKRKKGRTRKPAR